MPSSELSAETHTENLEGTSDEKPLHHQRKLAGVRDLAWNQRHPGKNTKNNLKNKTKPMETNFKQPQDILTWDCLQRDL